MRTWVQKCRRSDGFPSTHSDDLKSHAWENPTGLFHVHVGYYTNPVRPQVTLIMDGKRYTFEDAEDKLGVHIATGTLEEMQEVYETYARML